MRQNMSKYIWGGGGGRRGSASRSDGRGRQEGERRADMEKGISDGTAVNQGKKM